MTLKALPLTDETREMLMRAYDVLLSGAPVSTPSKSAKAKTIRKSKPSKGTGKAKP